MSPTIQNIEISYDVPPELDFCSNLFDAVAALRSNYVILPYPKSKTYNNLAEYYSHSFAKKKSENDSNQSSLKPAKNQHLVLKRNYAWYFATLGLDLPNSSNKRRSYKFSKKKRNSCGKYVTNKTLFKEVSTEMFEPIRSEKIVVKRSNGSLKQYILRNGEIKIARRSRINKEIPKSNESSSSEDKSSNVVNQQVTKNNTLNEKVSTSKSHTQLTESAVNSLSQKVKDFAVHSYQNDKIYTVYSLRQKMKTLQQLHSSGCRGIKHNLITKSDELEVLNSGTKIVSSAQSGGSDIVTVMKLHFEENQQNDESSADLLNSKAASVSIYKGEHHLKIKRNSEIITENIKPAISDLNEVLDKTVMNANYNVELNGVTYINKVNEEIAVCSKEINISMPQTNSAHSCPSASIQNENIHLGSSCTSVSTDICTSLENEFGKLEKNFKDIATCEKDKICKTDEVGLYQSSPLTMTESDNVQCVGNSTLAVRENNGKYSKEKALLDLARKARDKLRAEKEKKLAKELCKINTNSVSIHKDIIKPNCSHTIDNDYSIKNADRLERNIHFTESDKTNLNSHLEVFPEPHKSCDAIKASIDYNFNSLNTNNSTIMPVLSEVNGNNCNILSAHKVDKINSLKENNTALHNASILIKDTKKLNLKNKYVNETIFSSCNVDEHIGDLKKLLDVNWKKEDVAKQSKFESDLPVLVSINLKLINVSSLIEKKAVVSSVLKDRNATEASNKRPSVKIPDGNALKGYKIPKKRQCIEDTENRKSRRLI